MCAKTQFSKNFKIFQNCEIEIFTPKIVILCNYRIKVNSISNFLIFSENWLFDTIWDFLKVWSLINFVILTLKKVFEIQDAWWWGLIIARMPWWKKNETWKKKDENCYIQSVMNWLFFQNPTIVVDESKDERWSLNLFLLQKTRCKCLVALFHFSNYSHPKFSLLCPLPSST